MQHRHRENFPSSSSCFRMHRKLSCGIVRCNSKDDFYTAHVFIKKLNILINSTYRVWLRWVCGNWEQWKHILSICWVHNNNNFSDLWRLCLICCKLRSTDPRLLWYQRRQNRLAESGEGSNAPKTIPIRPEVLRALALLPKREAEGLARSRWKKFMVTERRVDRSSLQTRLAHLYCSVKICRCHWSG